MKKSLVFVMLLCVCSSGFATKIHVKVHRRAHHLKAGAPSVSLSCTESSTGVTGFNFYRSGVSGSGYVKLNAAPVASCAYMDATVVDGSTYYYVATAVNTAGESAYSAQAMAAVPAALVIGTASLAAGQVGAAYSVAMSASGGVAPYTWTDSPCSGACNTGLSFSTAGVLSGTPANVGTSTFTFTVTDAVGDTAQKQLSIVISAQITVPNPPTGLTIGTITSRNRVPLKWRAPVPQAEYALSGYDVLRNTGGGWAQRAAVLAPSYQDACAGSCSWEVVAVDSVGGKKVSSAPSNIVSIKMAGMH